VNIVEQLLNTEASELIKAANIAATRIPTKPGGSTRDTIIGYAALGFLKYCK
jgi:hypothetical protein